jgi:hypothetical protein
MEGLGRLFDVSVGYVNIDLNTSGATGKRVSLKNATGVSFICILPATAATEDIVFDVQQHTASSGGTSGDMDAAAGVAVTTTAGIDHFYIKSATTLAGTETWAKVANTAGSEVTVSGATYGASQCIVVIEVAASMLGDGYSYVSIINADPGSTARVVSVIAVLHDLNVKRAPANLAAALA